MQSEVEFPKISELHGHFVDKTGQKWIVEIPEALLEAHYHQDEPYENNGIYFYKTSISSYCLRLLKDDDEKVLRVYKDESNVEV